MALDDYQRGRRDAEMWGNDPSWFITDTSESYLAGYTDFMREEEFFAPPPNCPDP